MTSIADPTAIVPWHIDVPEIVLDDLHRRLEATRWPDQPTGTAWEYGTERESLRALCSYWRHAFDWRAVEARANAVPQYVTEVEGTRIHFVHVRSPHPDALPVVVLHGWPGSYLEFLDVIGPLTDPVAHGGDAADAFDVVIPSLPGFGFSGPTSDRGWTPQRMAGAVATLMDRLQYPHYGAQGGDWGSMVTAQLALHVPERVNGIHLNFVAVPEPLEDPWRDVTEDERAEVEAWRARADDEMGYSAIQRTRPQTLAYGLADSPSGLAGWLLEKFQAWSDCAGPDGVRDLWRRFTRDEVLAIVTSYWVTGTIGSSMRIYWEACHGGPGVGIPDRFVPVPMGLARFPGNGLNPPLAWTRRLYDVQHWTSMPSGGHFAAMEEPTAFVDDVRTFFRTLR